MPDWTAAFTSEFRGHPASIARYLGGHEPDRLPDDGPEGAGIQFPVRGNRQRLTPGRRIVAVMFWRNSGIASLGTILARMPIERTRVLVRVVEPLREAAGPAPLGSRLRFIRAR